MSKIKMKNIFLFIFEVGKIVLIALLIVIPIRYFLFQPFFVRGASMEPNFQNSDYLIVDQISYRFREPQRGEVVVFRHPGSPARRYIKRIIGLPGETIKIEDNKVIVYSQVNGVVLDESDYLLPNTQTLGEIKVILAEYEFFVLGDNRIASSDSRRWGPLFRKDIIGRVFFRAWPFDNLTIFEAPVFNK